jgi:hypothetical protein
MSLHVCLGGVMWVPLEPRLIRFGSVTVCVSMGFTDLWLPQCVFEFGLHLVLAAQLQWGGVSSSRGPSLFLDQAVCCALAVPQQYISSTVARCDSYI